ncbi:MAG: protein translocase subunit SecD [Deltaproteobacteria bacterium]|nr:protein translocase subunit SecD [Deltaproteobacteria bacterium]
MTRNWWGKLCLLLFFVGLSIVYVFPTLARLDLEKTKFPFKKKINLGLDLQGGLYLVLGVDFNKVYKDIVDRQVEVISASFKEKNIILKSVKVQREGVPVDDPRILLEFDPAQRDAVYKIIKKEFTILRLADDQAGKLELGLTREQRNDIRERTVNQSIQVIRNRIDEFGVTEPAIASQGLDRVVVELPGIKEVDRAKQLIGRTAKLEFKIADDKSMTPGQVAKLIADVTKENNISYKEGQKFSEYVQKINDLVKSKIPQDTEIAFERSRTLDEMREEGDLGQMHRRPYLLKSKVDVTGNDLQDAVVAFDPENQRPIVSFTMNARGAVLFEKLTGEHIHERLAIVLDGIVYSAPTIQSKIGGRGQITLGTGNGEQLLKEAKDLAIVLRAGALPAQLDFLEQRVVGPSLGQDSIHKGALASLLGSLAVFLFVMFYYRVSGAIAVVSLLLNVLFVLACLVGLEATLTLPGIAGIALTVGIAVDSNVVIYERIREELRHGKGPQGAVEAGFQKALPAVVLLIYGTGPIKGFAVTMLIGIVTTLFTAVFVCKLIFDWYLMWLEKNRTRSISI